MKSNIRNTIKSTPFIVPFIFIKKFLTKPKTQNDESIILHRLLQQHDIPHSFIEFGFSGWEFNCASLVQDWDGLLVDGDAYNVKIANIAYPRIQATQAWLTLDNLDFIIDYGSSRPLGILSVDVDGNDYWFLEKLITLRPAIIIAEYNSSFGLAPVTVPYDPEFDRRTKHETRTYYGASLSAIYYLADLHGYSLIDVTNTGINAFFIRDDLMAPDDLALKPECAFREKLFIDGSRRSEQWANIERLPFVDVSK